MHELDSNLLDVPAAFVGYPLGRMLEQGDRDALARGRLEPVFVPE
jgi:hypothetical protein